MRFFVRPLIAISLLTAVSACADSSTGTHDIGQELSGVWIEPTTTPGSSFTLFLAASGGTIAGTGQYAVEAGPAGSVTVTGSYTGNQVTLAVHYDFGLDGQFSGVLDVLGHLRGTYYVQDPPYPLPTVVFVKLAPRGPVD